MEAFLISVNRSESFIFEHLEMVARSSSCWLPLDVISSIGGAGFFSAHFLPPFFCCFYRRRLPLHTKNINICVSKKIIRYTNIREEKEALFVPLQKLSMKFLFCFSAFLCPTETRNAVIQFDAAAAAAAVHPRVQCGQMLE